MPHVRNDTVILKKGHQVFVEGTILENIDIGETVEIETQE
jgi:hypothetical protein